LIAPRALLRSVAVVRFRLLFATALALGAVVGSLLHAQVGDEEKSTREESPRKRHKTHAISSSTPAESPSPIAKAKAASGKSRKKGADSATPEESPKPIRKAKAASEKPVDESSASPTPEESPHPVQRATLARKPGEEEETTPKPKPSETREPTAVSRKAKKSPSPTPKPKVAKKKSRKKEASPKAKRTAKGKGAAKERETPKPKKTPRPISEESPAPSESFPPPPHTIAVPAPAASPQTKIPRAAPAEERAQVVIEKSGFEEEQGLEPPPSPPPRRGFWPWSRIRPAGYRYLSSSVIDAIRRAPVQRRRWQFIVVHNSGTRQGNARVFDYYHRHVRRMQNGLAYHFVIGNGTSTGNGQIEVGDRWRRQINGGHVHSDYLNNISLGICLVGDFNRDQPTRAQLESCEELIRYLRERCGKIGRHDIVVRPHREMNPPRWPTDCPGDVFPYSWFRRFQ
jgi:hypothetical protein